MTLGHSRFDPTRHYTKRRRRLTCVGGGGLAFPSFALFFALEEREPLRGQIPPMTSKGLRVCMCNLFFVSRTLPTDLASRNISHFQQFPQRTFTGLSR